MLANYKTKIKTIKKDIIEILNKLLKANEIVLKALKSQDKAKFNSAKTQIKNISKKTNNIDNAIVATLALYSPEAKDLRALVSYLKITNELLRASSNARGFIKSLIAVSDKMNTETINKYAIPMQKLNIESLESIISMINTDCIDEAKECYDKILIADNKTDDLYKVVEDLLLNGFNDSYNFTEYYKIIGALRKSEKISDRTMSMASLLLYSIHGGNIK